MKKISSFLVLVVFLLGLQGVNISSAMAKEITHSKVEKTEKKEKKSKKKTKKKKQAKAPQKKKTKADKA